jgi:hypothetical protein
MNKRYYAATFFLAFFVSPIVIGVLLLIGIYIDSIFMYSLVDGEFMNNVIESLRFDFISPVFYILHIGIPVYLFALLAWGWYEYMKKAVFSEEKHKPGKASAYASEVFAPIIASYLYFMLVFIVISCVTKYSIEGSGGAPVVFHVFTLPFFFVMLMLSFSSNQEMFPVLVIAINAAIIAATMFAKARTKSKMIYNKKFKAQIIAVIGSLTVVGFQFLDKAINSILN